MQRHRTRAFTSVAFATALWACGDGGTEPPPDPPRPETVTVTPATVTLAALGEIVRLSAEVRDQNGQVMANAAVTWSSGDTTVATVDASGLVTAVDNGEAAVTATADSVSGSANVTVAQVISTVNVSPSADTLVEADTLRLSAEAKDANGHAVAGAAFAWLSDDTAVAVLDDAGLVTGVAPGEVEVMATSAGVSGRAALVVVAPVPTTVLVTPDTVELEALDDTVRLSTEVRDQADRPMEGVAVHWASGDTLVASVDSAGLVTAAANGAARVTARVGEASGSAWVRVVQSPRSVTVSPLVDTIAPGDTLRLTATASDENGHTIEGAGFAWSSSDVTAVQVDSSGLVTGLGVGVATITAASGDLTGTADITVENPDRTALAGLYQATDGPSWFNSDNWLTEAPLGTWYGVDTDDLGRVVSLNLNSNGLNGEIPAELVHLTKLQALDLGESPTLRGRLPSELGNLTNLTRLSIWFTQLTGEIPPELGSLTRLTTLILTGNQLTGPIPPDLGNLANLDTLMLSGPLTGVIPPELGQITSLTHLFLGGNFTGPIPAGFGRLTNLRNLQLSGSDLSGPIPPELGDLTNLTELRLYYSALTGGIPKELGNLSRLKKLLLNDNKLTGSIPPELGNLSQLEFLLLSQNELTGPIPAELGNLTQLTGLFFVANAGLCAPGTSSFVAWLKGISSQGPYCNKSDADALNRLYQRTGGADWTNSAEWNTSPALDEWYGVSADSLGRVVTLDLTGNGLVGPLPAVLGSLSEMTRLRIGDNALTRSVAT